MNEKNWISQVLTQKFFKTLSNFDETRDKRSFFSKGTKIFPQQPNIWLIWPDYLGKSWQRKRGRKYQHDLTVSPV
jgi:hypothetical protein